MNESDYRRGPFHKDSSTHPPCDWCVWNVRRVALFWRAVKGRAELELCPDAELRPDAELNPEFVLEPVPGLELAELRGICPVLSSRRSCGKAFARVCLGEGYEYACSREGNGEHLH